MSDVLELWNSAPKPEELAKSMEEVKERNKEVLPKSAIINPLDSAFFGGTRPKPTPIPYTTLRRMSQIPAIAAIINTRLNQVANHAKRPKFNGDKGFKIALKDRDAKMTDAQRKKAREMEDFFLKTGWIKNKVRKDNFNQFLRKITRDTLSIDVMTFEKVNKIRGALGGKMDIAEIWAIDAATIELVLNNPIGEGNDFQVPVYKPVTRSGIINIGDIAYVQKVDGTIVAEYTEDELSFAIRNPRTDLEFTDFGMSELETLMEIVTGILNGVRYNTSYFSSSSLPQGVMSLIGKYDDKTLKAFQRHWKTLTEGAAGKWAVPVMALEDGTGFQWTPFKNSNRDMEFNQFLEFLFNVACAVYQIDPNEVGFKSWTSNSGGMSQSDNTAEKNDISKDKGFIPLMNFLSDTFNSEIVDLIDDEFEFQWVGVDDEDEDKKLERQKQELESGVKTVAMIWKETDADVEDLKAQNGGELPQWAYAPANPQLIQVFTSEQQAQQQQQLQQQQGDQQMAQNFQQAQFQQAQANDAHGKQLEVLDKQHQQTMQAKAVDQLHDRNQQAGQFNNDSKLQQNDHKHQLGMQKLTHDQQKELAQQDQQHQLGMQQNDHAHSDKQLGSTQAHQVGMQNMQQEHADKQLGSNQAHQVGMQSAQQDFESKNRAEDRQHQVFMAKTNQEHGMASKQVDHAHQKEMAQMTAEQKAKKEKLKKAIESDFKSLGIDIDWGEY